MSHRGEGVWYPEANLTVAEGDDDQIGGPRRQIIFLYLQVFFFYFAHWQQVFFFSPRWSEERISWIKYNIYYWNIKDTPPPPFSFCLRYEYIENKIKN